MKGEFRINDSLTRTPSRAITLMKLTTKTKERSIEEEIQLGKIIENEFALIAIFPIVYA